MVEQVCQVCLQFYWFQVKSLRVAIIYKFRGVDKNLNGNYCCSEVHLNSSMTGASCQREGKMTIQCHADLIAVLILLILNLWLHVMTWKNIPPWFSLWSPLQKHQADLYAKICVTAIDCMWKLVVATMTTPTLHLKPQSHCRHVIDNI